MKIPFNIPFTCLESAENIKHLVNSPQALAKKQFSKSCESWFRNLYPGYHALLVTSCTKAMELIALSMDIQEGDEIIMPSYCYVGVANSFANLGAKLVMVDIVSETMNIDAALIEAAMTEKTKAILVVHYGGVPCEMRPITDLCKRKNILLIEDNAQGIGVKYQGQLLGSFGDYSCISFDGLKNISCSQGGLLLFKESFKKSVVVCFENGTNRYEFAEGKIPCYEWVGRGSNFSISEYNAAVLFPLLLKSDAIIQDRKKRWQSIYNAIYREPSIRHLLTPKLLEYDHNAHIFFLKCTDKRERDELMNHLNSAGITTSFHYTPLHTSARGMALGLDMKHDRFTSSESYRLLRLPVYNTLSEADIQYMVQHLAVFFKQQSGIHAN